MSIAEVHALLPKLVNEQCSEAELQTFNKFIDEASYTTIAELSDTYYQLLSTKKSLVNEADFAKLYLKIEDKINSLDTADASFKANFTVLFISKKWKKILSTAAAFIIITIGTYFFIKAPQPTLKANNENQLVNDVVAGSKKAVLTVDDGTSISLAEQKNGLLTAVSTHEIQKTNNQLVYNNPNKATEIHYHTISTPNGGEYEVILEDGTKVWLNAASSLRFPTTFTGNNRTVSLTGEAYFEVSSNKLKPFIVQVGNTNVEVLGTRFNVMFYSNEPSIKTTLVEGSVVVNNNNQKTMLQPGNQAIITQEKVETIPVDINEAVAWKNGLFTFNKTDLKTIMRQLARWYDVEVSYEGKIPEKKFVGDIDRNSNLSQVLRILTSSGIKFTIEGKKLIVSN